MVIQKQYQPDPSRIFVIHKSIESEAFKNARELRNKVIKQYPVVLFIGGNMQRKGLPDLISAAPKILEEVPNTEFWVVGNDNAEPRMRKLCRDLRVEHRFRFLGRKTQSELAEIYARSDVFCMPSLSEAFGVVFLEAMSAGVPVIASRAGGVVEIVQDEVNGLLVNPGDQQEISRKILQLLRDEKLREHLREGGMETVQHFTVEKMMAETYEVYRTVTGKE
jgi:phosphatidylinositol alpha-1,6-mannosyltransferase